MTKGFGDRVLIENLSFSIPQGAIVEIVGPNGAGKTTLFKMIEGHEEADSGTIVVGETIKMANVGQMRDELDDSGTAWEEVSDGLDLMDINGWEVASRAYPAASTSRAGPAEVRRPASR